MRQTPCFGLTDRSNGWDLRDELRAARSRELHFSATLPFYLASRGSLSTLLVESQTGDLDFFGSAANASRRVSARGILRATLSLPAWAPQLALAWLSLSGVLAMVVRRRALPPAISPRVHPVRVVRSGLAARRVQRVHSDVQFAISLSGQCSRAPSRGGSVHEGFCSSKA